MMFAALPPSSSVSRLPVPASSRWIDLPTSVEPVKAILSTSWMLDERGPRAPVAGDDVDDARRQLGLAEHVGEEQRRERRRLGGLEDDRVARRECRRDLPREHEQREVPGNDLAGNADRTRRPVRERVLELVGPARVVEEVRGRERKIDVARLADRLAAVQRLEDGELPRALLEDARDPVEVLRPLGRREAGPAVLERVPRRGDGQADLLGGRLPDLGEGLLARGVDRRVGLVRLEPLAADEVAVPLTKLNEVARLGRGRVVPARRDGRPILLALELGHWLPLGRGQNLSGGA